MKFLLVAVLLSACAVEGSDTAVPADAKESTTTASKTTVCGTTLNIKDNPEKADDPAQTICVDVTYTIPTKCALGAKLHITAAPETDDIALTGDGKEHTEKNVKIPRFRSLFGVCGGIFSSANTICCEFKTTASACASGIE